MQVMTKGQIKILEQKDVTEPRRIHITPAENDNNTLRKDVVLLLTDTELKVLADMLTASIVRPDLDHIVFVEYWKSETGATVTSSMRPFKY